VEYYPKTSITGVILAGGRAQRMGGRDKGLLPLAGLPMIAHVIRVMQPQVGELLLNANRNLSVYQELGFRVVSDSMGQFYGPLAGMLAAMEATANPYLLSVPCDSPLLAADCVQRFYQVLLQTEAELCVAHDGIRLQPVFALLTTTLRVSLRHYLTAGERKIDRWFAQHRMVPVDFSDSPHMFRNINTPKDLTTLERDIAEGAS
jgi:molybdopterin-guanine dinucleotide biosynthesis protein A